MKQGEAKGTVENGTFFVGNKPKYLEESKKITLLTQISSSFKKMAWTFFWAASILASEAFVIWLLINYTGLFEGNPVKYVKVFVSLFIVRLVFRTTILDKKEK